MRDERDEYNKHMDEMAARICLVLDDELPVEAALACCAVIGYSLSQLKPDDRAHATPVVLNFLNRILGRDN